MYYWNHFNDTIFELDNSVVNEKYVLNKDRYKLTPKIADEDDNNTVNMCYIPKTILETKKYLIIIVKQFGQWQVDLFDKNSNVIKRNSKLDDNVYFENDLDGGIDFLPTNYYENNGVEYLISFVDPIEINSYVKK